MISIFKVAFHFKSCASGGSSCSLCSDVVTMCCCGAFPTSTAGDTLQENFQDVVRVRVLDNSMLLSILFSEVRYNVL